MSVGRTVGERRGRARGARAAIALALLASMLGAAATSRALEWGLIEPGETEMDAVRARHGTATRTTTQKVDDYNTTQWVYEGAQAPVGMERMVVDFGLLSSGTYRPQIVRSVLLYPRPGAFTRLLVVQGWGMPTAVGTQGGAPAYMYEEGLFVTFDDAGWEVTSMLFTPRQKIPPPESPPPKPAPPR